MQHEEGEGKKKKGSKERWRKRGGIKKCSVWWLFISLCRGCTRVLELYQGALSACRALSQVYNVNEEMSLHYVKLLESTTREYKVNC